ncbi:hypothetical protein [Candidatus Parabeggiatoa sp. HSG14]|uniref:hypothetical protein n=1 Tax=Candidatus Parabeggiatoa sp. HSG14 TaxID=3055593 RepID=UPI0025A8F948|nr:hypothetical protein [Thiotrichales bacterium HSG14]
MVLIRTAWICDDAYITFRVIDNFINGHGLRWNVAERVQAYTNPLWMFLLSGFYFFTREIYLTSIAVSIFLSTVSIYLLAFKIAKSRFSALLALSILIFSTAFVDYSTSGLENPLTYFFIALFFTVYLNQNLHHNKTIFLLALIAALAMFNRMDSILLFIPILILVFWKNRSWKVIALMMGGFVPFFLWELFSLIYYGFLFPNTAYAKLNTGIPSHELLQQGIYYLHDSFLRDPITLSTIGVAFLLPLLTKQWKLLPLVLSILLSVIYIVKVGGDFMSGRFLTASLFIAVIILSQYSLQNKYPEKCCLKLSRFDKSRLFSKIRNFFFPLTRAFILTLILLLGFLSPAPPLLSGTEYQMNKPIYHGISDERGVYYSTTGLLLARSNIQMPNHAWAVEGKTIWQGKNATITRQRIGFLGFFAGSTVHIIDPLALADSFLARLPPALHYWRIGHFWRRVPQGYLESIQQGKNRIADKHLADLYDKIQLVIRGKLFTAERWNAIWLLNFGNYKQFIEKSRYNKSSQNRTTNDEAYFDKTGILTLPKIILPNKKTYIAELQLTTGFVFEFVNFSPIIARSYYYDSLNRRLLLPKVKRIGTEEIYEIELTLLDHHLTVSSRFVVTSIMLCVE